MLLKCALLGFQKYVPSEHPEVPTGNLTTEGYKRSHPVPRNHLLRTTRGGRKGDDSQPDLHPLTICPFSTVGDRTTQLICNEFECKLTVPEYT